MPPIEEQREEPLLLEEVWDGDGGVVDMLGCEGWSVGVGDVLGSGDWGVGVEVRLEVVVAEAADVGSVCAVDRVEATGGETGESELAATGTMEVLELLVSSKKLPSVNPHWQPHVWAVHSASPPQSTTFWRGKS